MTVLLQIAYRGGGSYEKKIGLQIVWYGGLKPMLRINALILSIVVSIVRLVIIIKNQIEK